MWWRQRQCAAQIGQWRLQQQRRSCTVLESTDCNKLTTIFPQIVSSPEYFPRLNSFHTLKRKLFRFSLHKRKLNAETVWDFQGFKSSKKNSFCRNYSRNYGKLFPNEILKTRLLWVGSWRKHERHMKYFCGTVMDSYGACIPTWTPNTVTWYSYYMHVVHTVSCVCTREMYY